MLRSTLFVAAFVMLATACAAPPMGLGMGAAVPTPAGHSGAVFAGATGLGASGSRTVFQAEAAVSLQRHARASRRVFGLDAGMVYTQVADEPGDAPRLTAAGGFPYVRPRVMLGAVSLAVALAGMGIGAGGGGIIGGIADVQLGYGAPTWSVYTGMYSLVYDMTGGDRTVAKQLRAGAEYLMPMRSARFGVALELYLQDDALVDRSSNGEHVVTHARREGQFVGAGLKLRIMTDVVR